MKLWKIEAEGDTVYAEGRDVHDAYCTFVKVIGQVPFEILDISEVDSLPVNEVLL